MGLASPWGREEEAHQEELGGGLHQPGDAVGGCISLGTLRGLGALCSCSRACLGQGAPRESWMGGVWGLWGSHQIALRGEGSQGRSKRVGAAGGSQGGSGQRVGAAGGSQGGSGQRVGAGALCQAVGLSGRLLGGVELDAWAAWGPSATLAALLGRGPSGHLSGWVWGWGLREQGFWRMGGGASACSAVPLLLALPP